MSIGKNIVDGVWNGIKSAKETFKKNISSFFTGLVDGVKSALGINSPSKVFANEVGKWIPAGISLGIDKNAKTTLNSMKNLANGMVNEARNGLTEVSGGISGNVSGGVVNNYTQVINSPKALSRLEIY